MGGGISRYFEFSYYIIVLDDGTQGSSAWKVLAQFEGEIP